MKSTTVHPHPPRSSPRTRLLRNLCPGPDVSACPETDHSPLCRPLLRQASKKTSTSWIHAHPHARPACQRLAWPCLCRLSGVKSTTNAMEIMRSPRARGAGRVLSTEWSSVRSALSKILLQGKLPMRYRYRGYSEDMSNGLRNVSTSSSVCACQRHFSEMTVPSDANTECPGTDSQQAGTAAACAGCPNQVSPLSCLSFTFTVAFWNPRCFFSFLTRRTFFNRRRALLLPRVWIPML